MHKRSSREEPPGTVQGSTTVLQRLEKSRSKFEWQPTGHWRCRTTELGTAALSLLYNSRWAYFFNPEEVLKILALKPALSQILLLRQLVPGLLQNVSWTFRFLAFPAENSRKSSSWWSLIKTTEIGPVAIPSMLYNSRRSLGLQVST